MINCPNCSESTISRLKLVLQYFSVPLAVASCSKCDAVVFIAPSNNLTMGILLYVSWCAALIMAMFVSFNIVGSMWAGAFLVAILYVGRAYLKSGNDLEYVR